MKCWDQRPFEVRNLFNPAFCGLLLYKAMKGYEQKDPEGMPFSLVLLVLPLCLYRDSREILAENPRSYLLKIVEKNPQLLVGFADRARQLLPYAQEALGFLMSLGCFSVSEEGRLKLLPNAKVRQSLKGTDEAISCQKVAIKIGKDFACIADRVTVYKTFGIRP